MGAFRHLWSPEQGYIAKHGNVTARYPRLAGLGSTHKRSPQETAHSSMSVKPNKLLRLVTKINTKAPEIIRPTVLSLAFNSYIRYAGTTGLRIDEWNLERSVVTLKNRFHVQNHLGTVHATAMATLAESATGMVFGLYVPDNTHIPLLKSMRIQYTARAVGDLTAVATVFDKAEELAATERGSVIVPVKVTDAEGKEPIQCEMEWAWTTKKKKKLKS